MISPIKIRITDRDKNFNLKSSVSPVQVVIYDIDLGYAKLRSVLFKWKENISKYISKFFGYTKQKISFNALIEKGRAFVNFYGKFSNKITFLSKSKRAVSVFFLKPNSDFKFKSNATLFTVNFEKCKEKFVSKAKIDSNYVMLFVILKLGYWCENEKTLANICYSDSSMTQNRTLGSVCYDEVRSD